MPTASPEPLEKLKSFIAHGSGGDGGQERANYALFLTQLCDVLAVPQPRQASHAAETNGYTFERAATFREPDGATSSGRIDLYKRGCFVLAQPDGMPPSRIGREIT